jgi:hypothetical protein
MNMTRTHVYLTVDIECAEERVLPSGQVKPALGYDLRIWGRFSNQRRDLGIGLVMSVLDRYGLKATFFTEALGASYFGDAGLAEVCEAIRARGHDIQLHCHPIQRRPDWKTRGEPRLSDFLCDYSVSEQEAMLRAGLATLERCGASRADLMAFRAGNFGANNDTWTAMARAGLSLSSNYDLTYLEPVGGACRIAWPHEEAVLFDTGVGVFELPITSLRERSGYRRLQVLAISGAEMRDALLQARALGLPEVCIVTHSFEYFYVDSIRERRGRSNWLNERRLEDLCAFLNEHSHDFEVETVGALAKRLPVERSANRLPLPQGRSALKVRRLIEQGVKRLQARRSEALVAQDR